MSHTHDKIQKIILTAFRAGEHVWGGSLRREGPQKSTVGNSYSLLTEKQKNARFVPGGSVKKRGKKEIGDAPRIVRPCHVKQVEGSPTRRPSSGEQAG